MPEAQQEVIAVSPRQVVIWLLLALVVTVADVLLKRYMDANLGYGIPYEVLPVFDLTLLYNKGAAFSMLADQPGWQRWFFSGVAIAASLLIITWLFRTHPQKRLEPLGLALILGGALGNLYDRVTLGYVIDFISLHYKNYYFPAFNLADTAICCGAGLLILDISGLIKKPNQHDN